MTLSSSYQLHLRRLLPALLATLLGSVALPAQTVPKAEAKISYSGTGDTRSAKKLKEAPTSDQPGSLPVQVDALVRDVMQKQQVPGLTLAVMRNGEIVLSRGYGLADVENKVPATAAAEIHTASIAKPMTAIAAMELVQQGKLDLDAPVQQYCPAFPPKTSPDGKPWIVTTRELLAHRAGVRWYRDDGEAKNAKHYANLNDAVKHFGGEPLLFEPGTEMRYSTYGYVVVGCVIEGASHESYLPFMQKAVFDPADMQSTWADDPREIILHRARGYDLGPDKNKPVLENAPFFDPSDRVPGGGFLSTSEDLVRFAAAVMAGKLVPQATLDLMWKGLSDRDDGSSYGLGWGIGNVSGWRVVGHNGGQAGTSTTLKLVPASQFAVAVMTNLEGAQLDGLAEAILKLYLTQKKPD